MVETSWWVELEAAEMKAGARLQLSCVLNLNPQPMGSSCPSSGCIFPPTLISIFYVSLHRLLRGFLM